MANLPARAPNYTPEQISAAMIEAGLMPQPSAGGSEIVRIKVSGNNFMVGDDIIAVYNPVKKEPALRVLIADAPGVLQQLWFTRELAELTGHDELLTKMGDSGMFCKSHEADPNEALKYSENGFECRACPVNGFVRNDDLPILADGTKAKRCSMGADLEVWIVDPATNLPADETLYTMSLSSTSLVEFRGGTGKNADRSKGYSQINPKARHDNNDSNFLQKLVELGLAEGMLPGDTALALRTSRVLADARSLPAANKESGFNWNVLSFTPVAILPADTTPKLENTDAAGDTSSDDLDAIPF